MDYCTINDVIALYRALSADETAKATALIPIVSSRLRMEAKKRGYDLDAMISEDADLKKTAIGITVDIIARAIMTPDTAPMTNFTEGAMGYSYSGTFLSPGGGLFIKDAELRALGIKKQRIGSISLI